MTVRDLEHELILGQKWCVCICDPDAEEDQSVTGDYEGVHLVCGDSFRVPWFDYTIRFIRTFGNELYVYVWDESKFADSTF